MDADEIRKAIAENAAYAAALGTEMRAMYPRTLIHVPEVTEAMIARAMAGGPLCILEECRVEVLPEPHAEPAPDWITKALERLILGDRTEET